MKVSRTSAEQEQQYQYLLCILTMRYTVQFQLFAKCRFSEVLNRFFTAFLMVSGKWKVQKTTYLSHFLGFCAFWLCVIVRKNTLFFCRKWSNLAFPEPYRSTFDRPKTSFSQFADNSDNLNLTHNRAEINRPAMIPAIKTIMIPVL